MSLFAKHLLTDCANSVLLYNTPAPYAVHTTSDFRTFIVYRGGIWFANVHYNPGEEITWYGACPPQVVISAIIAFIVAKKLLSTS